MKKLKFSQMAHKRLQGKHKTLMNKNPKDYDKHFVLTNYHSSCIHIQDRLKRKLTVAERKKVYEDVILTFY